MPPAAKGEEITGSSGQQLKLLSRWFMGSHWSHRTLVSQSWALVDETKPSQDQTPVTFATAMEKV
jgi:hypothetical protein